jgi:hypothetical protein
MRCLLFPQFPAPVWVALSTSGGHAGQAGFEQVDIASVEPRPGHPRNLAQPLHADGALVILDKAETAHLFQPQLGVLLAQPGQLGVLGASAAAPGRSARSAERTQCRSVSWLTPNSLATCAIGRPDERTSSAASARNPAEYLHVPNKDSSPQTT